ncbi:hypothetical protein Emag_006699 [Eimeria magna]
MHAGKERRWTETLGPAAAAAALRRHQPAASLSLSLPAFAPAAAAAALPSFIRVESPKTRRETTSRLSSSSSITPLLLQPTDSCLATASSSSSSSNSSSSGWSRAVPPVCSHRLLEASASQLSPFDLIPSTASQASNKAPFVTMTAAAAAAAAAAGSAAAAAVARQQLVGFDGVVVLPPYRMHVFKNRKPQE